MKSKIKTVAFVLLAFAAIKALKHAKQKASKE